MPLFLADGLGWASYEQLKKILYQLQVMNGKPPTSFRGGRG